MNTLDSNARANAIKLFLTLKAAVDPTDSDFRTSDISKESLKSTLDCKEEGEQDGKRGPHKDTKRSIYQQQGDNIQGHITERSRTLEDARKTLNSDVQPKNSIKEIRKSTPNFKQGDHRQEYITKLILAPKAAADPRTSSRRRSRRANMGNTRTSPGPSTSQRASSR